MNDQMPPSGEAICHGMAGPPGHVNGGRDDPHQKKSNIRKRTKTGCLTCRKRRIKCDEGRPTCNNCIKSKRHCEGYNQRVIFKPSLGVPSHPLDDPFNSLNYLHGSEHALNQFTQLHGRPSGHGALPNLAPKPPSSVEYMPISHIQHYGPQYHGQPNQPTFHAPGPNNTLFPQNLSETFLAPNLVPHHGLGGHFPPSAVQSSEIHQHFGHPPPPKGGPAYAAHAGSSNMTVALAHRNHVSGTPAHTQLASTEVKGEADDIKWEDSDDDHENSTALVAPVPGGLYMPGKKDLSTRSSFHGFANMGVVSEYMNSPNLSGFKDMVSRQFFEHFMRVTGPSMSLYERHPFDASEQGVSGPISGTETSIWSYTFPVISFHHPGLLHAMLASASLQVAKLQGAPATSAMKHYAIAIRRIAKNVKTPSRRTHPATLAATLLLGYFEVWNGDHNTWCNHLYGARILFTEIPLRAMSRRCLPAKSLRDRQVRMKKMGLSGFGVQHPQDHDGLNYQLLSLMTGYSVSAADYGMTEDHILCSDHSATTERDVSNYENLRDLFWWYCKMDVYQSILGGTPLFMEYENWTQCPPRAPASRLECIYGTYDHLMLLLGRLVDFAAKDLSRKRRQHQARGHHPDSSPPFPGMIPTNGEFHVPMGFSPPRQEPQPDPTEGMDPEASLQAASKEWEAIRNAFSCFENHLGAEFQPLGPEYADNRDYPFGPALQYRSFSVAGIWMNYYMGLIHLYRSHPIMPPAAMASVGLAASNTYEFANRLGRIAVGLSDNFDNMNEVSTVMAAALIESAFCLFVASVQYQDDEQRRWVVKRMLDITRLTGWQSARQIAEGCEASWTKSAEMGQGPPYNRMAMPTAPPEVVWHNVRRIDRKIHEGDDRAEEKRLILARSERAHYALGLLGIEGDIEYLELKDHAFSRTV